MSPMLELLLCAAGVGLLLLILDYRPAPSPAQAQAIKERQEREARIRELTTFSVADLEVMHEQAMAALYEAKRTNWKYQHELRINLGICTEIRRRKKD